MAFTTGTVVKYIGTENRLTTNRAKTGVPIQYPYQVVPLQYRTGGVSTTATEVGTFVTDSRTTEVMLSFAYSSATTPLTNVRISPNASVEPIATTADGIHVPINGAAGTGINYGNIRIPVVGGATVGVGFFGATGTPTGTIRITEFGVRQIPVNTAV